MDANALITKGTVSLYRTQHFISFLFCHIEMIKEKICWHNNTAKILSNCLHSFVLLNENNKGHSCCIYEVCVNL